MSRSSLRSAALSFAIAFGLLQAGLAANVDRRPAAPLAGAGTISLRELQGGAWRVRFDLPRPVARLDLGPHLLGYRSRSWRVLDDGVEIVVENGRDVLRATRSGGRFSAARVDVAPQAIRMLRTYEALTPFGDGGVLIYTGHFQPWGENGARRDMAISVEPLLGRRVSAFGDVGPRLENWRSRFENPAFIYVGETPAVRNSKLVAAIDPETPDWAAREVGAFVIEVTDYLSGRFGWPLKATPNLFLSYGGNATPGRAMFEGDALPAQMRIGLRGGAWDTRSEFAENVLRQGLAHEAAHLWQTAARPISEDAPDWIHEGGADAIAAETLVALGWWGAPDLERDRAEARSRCFFMLRGASLPALEARGQVAASYDCGHLINELVARAHPEGAVGFWRAFVNRARAAGGYDADLFFGLAGELGGERFGEALRRFAILPQGRPAEAYLAAERALGAGLANQRIEAADADPSIAKAGDH